jgi:hypothetical protein
MFNLYILYIPKTNETTNNSKTLPSIGVPGGGGGDDGGGGFGSANAK